MVRIVPADDNAMSDETSAWLEEMNPRLANLEGFQLPADFPFVYARDSLPLLEAAVLARFASPDEADYRDDGEDDVDDRRFVEGVVAYLGETYLLVAGGSWSVRPEDHRPVVRFDDALAMPALSPLALLITALDRRTGHEFDDVYADLELAVAGRRAADPDWEPTKTHTLGVDRVEPPPPSDLLGAWRARHEKAFPEWAARHPGDWDFSAESLDALEVVVRATLTPTEELDELERVEAAQQAAWYLGETITRLKGGGWFYIPGETNPYNPVLGRPHLRQPAPALSVSVPILAIDSALRLRQPGMLREELDGYGS